MRQGPNLLKLARKEQCLALLTQLRTKFKCDGCVYRVYPNGEVQYLHPADGVYPEKVNPGRVQVNGNQRSIGKNGQPIDIKFNQDRKNPNTGKTETFWDGSSTDRGGPRFVSSGKE